MAIRIALLATLLLLAVPLPTGLAQLRPKSVPEKATHFEGHWYEAVTRKDGYYWRAAQEMAASRGGHLVCIETGEERKFVNGLVKSKPTWRFWIGGYRASDGWWWINGEPFSSNFKIGDGTSTGLRLAIGNSGNSRRIHGMPENKTKYGGFIIEYPSGGLDKISLPPRHSTPDKPTASRPEPSKPGATGTAITGNPNAPALPIERSQTQVKGLLVMALGGDEHAGTASPMTLTARHGDPSAPATIQFNQPVGTMMQKALGEVVTFIEVHHDGWPRGRTMEISFENKYNPKDGPSAAVACALLIDSALLGHELDPGFAVTGDMNADGSVQPIGGVEAKIRGATNRDCTHVALPAKNLASVYDTALLDGLGPVTEIQVFTIAAFEEAKALAHLQPGSPQQKAIDDFASIQEIYRNQPKTFSQSIKHPRTIERLQSILEAVPNHLSAAILLKHATGNAPATLSLHGSVSFIENNAFQIVDVITEKGDVAAVERLNNDPVADALSLLRRSRLRLDKRTWTWADELLRYGELIHELQTNRPSATRNRNQLVREINTSGDLVRAERKKLFSNPEVMEELLD